MIVTKRIFWLFCALMALALHLSQAQAQQRVALLIGNSTYAHASVLPNPRNDVADVGTALARLGFQVTTLNDLNFDGMRRSLRDFSRDAQRADIALVFFAGHGVEIGGENYLVPVDAEMRSDRDIEHEAMTLRSVMSAVSEARKLGLVILDACRNDPFRPRMTASAGAKRTVSRGLARVEPSGNLLVAYASREGTTADDGSERNSPFTAALLRHLETPGQEINFLFRRVRDDVLTKTGRRQEPAIYGSLGAEEIVLAIPSSLAGIVPPQQQSPQKETPSAPIVAPSSLPIKPPVDRSMAALRQAGWMVNPIRVRGDWVNSVALSADGRYLVTGSGDKTARLWDMATGRELRTYKHGSWVTSVALSADGLYLVTGSYAKTAKLWDMATGRELRTFTGHGNEIYSVALSADGRHLVTAGDGPAKLWNLATGRELRTFNQDNLGRFLSAALSTDGRYLVTSGTDGTNSAKLWDVATGRELRTFTGHSELVASVAISADGRHLVTGGYDKTAKLWDVETGREVRTFTGHSELVASVAISADGRHLVTGSADQTVRQWRLADGSLESVRISMGDRGWLLLDGEGQLQALAGNPDELYSLVKGTEVRSPSQMLSEGWQLPKPEPISNAARVP